MEMEISTMRVLGIGTVIGLDPDLEVCDCFHFLVIDLISLSMNAYILFMFI